MPVHRGHVNLAKCLKNDKFLIFFVAFRIPLSADNVEKYIFESRP